MSTHNKTTKCTKKAGIGKQIKESEKHTAHTVQYKNMIYQTIYKKIANIQII